MRTSELDNFLMGWFIFPQYGSHNFVHQNTAMGHNTFLSALIFLLLPEITQASKLDHLTPYVIKPNKKFKITSRYFKVYIFPFIFYYSIILTVLVHIYISFLFIITTKLLQAKTLRSNGLLCSLFYPTQTVCYFFLPVSVLAVSIKI